MMTGTYSCPVKLVQMASLLNNAQLVTFDLSVPEGMYVESFVQVHWLLDKPASQRSSASYQGSDTRC
jgi:hypothetical protein